MASEVITKLIFSYASNRCMYLHHFFGSVFVSWLLYWLGSGLLMQAHLKRPLKRAGEAGKALRTSEKLIYL